VLATREVLRFRAAAILGCVLVLTTGTTASAASAAPESSTHQSCSKFLSIGVIAGITGANAKVYEHPVSYPESFGVPDGPDDRNKIPGSVCDWEKVPANAEGLTEAAYLLVGYGETAKGWKRLVSYFKAGAPQTGWPIGFSTRPEYRPLSLGHGSKAFLITANLAAYYGYKEGEAGLPTYLYTITVLTGRHNLLQVFFVGASIEQTEEWVVNQILKGDAAFF
jgi:hypothetical protein